MQNGYIERFNRTYRESVFNSYISIISRIVACDIQRNRKTENCCFKLNENKFSYNM
ncbi:hypothetical protein [Chryseobacterium sp. 7]|uniref:hypothetical protein n=1 Tax=Chryseobacterium sp. 7 TaxID=2035214 RepID=UPI000EAE7C86